MGSLGNNGYIVICPETNQAVCIDTPDEPEKMLNEVRESGVDVQAILVTHGHGDHLAGLHPDHRNHRRASRHRRRGCSPAPQPAPASAQ